jgi:hypothetical protein
MLATSIYRRSVEEELYIGVGVFSNLTEELRTLDPNVWLVDR